MATAADITKLLNETKRADKAAFFLMDFVDFLNNYTDELDPKAAAAGKSIKKTAEAAVKKIKTISEHVNEALNKIEVDAEECQKGADNLLLYFNTLEEAIAHVNNQKQGYDEGTYWWRYWETIQQDLSDKIGG